MTSAEFLSRIGVRYWRDFERRAHRDIAVLECYSETARPDLYENVDRPLTCNGSRGRIVGRLGEVGDRLYIHYAGFWLSPRVFMVAAVYKTPGTSADSCDVHFFSFRPRRPDRFKEVDESHPDVQDCLKQYLAAAA